jgi:hypothetical protein
MHEEKIHRTEQAAFITSHPRAEHRTKSCFASQDSLEENGRRQEKAHS